MIPSSSTLTFLRFWNVRFRMDNLSRRVGSCTHSSKNFSESWVSSKESLDVMLKTNMIFSFKIQIKNESIDKLSLIHVYHNTRDLEYLLTKSFAGLPLLWWQTVSI